MNSTLSEFGFTCKDGYHKYIYNRSAKLSSFYLYKNGIVVYREDCYCSEEEWHIKRIRLDFNENSIDLPNFSEINKPLITFKEVLLILNNIKDSVLTGKINIFVLIVCTTLIAILYCFYFLLVGIYKISCLLESIKNASQKVTISVKKLISAI